LPIAWVERIFTVLSARYGKQFADMWAGQNTAAIKAVWSDDMAGFTGDEIRRGLEACKTRRYPPSLPDFIELCRPPLNHEQAFYEAVQGMARFRMGENVVWSHPAVYWAAAAMGNDIMTAPYSSLKARWSASLARAIGQGRKTTPAPAPALPAPPKVVADPERVSQMLGELAKKLKIN